MILINILESVERPALFFARIIRAADWLRNGLEQMICFKPVEMGGLWHFQRILRRFFGLKRNGRGHNYDLTNLNLVGHGFGGDCNLCRFFYKMY